MKAIVLVVENPENKQEIIRRLIYINLFKQLENMCGAVSLDMH